MVMFYCDLCHKYLPKLNRGDPDELVHNHCISPGHQNAFVKIEAEKRLEEHEALKQLERVRMYCWCFRDIHNYFLEISKSKIQKFIQTS